MLICHFWKIRWVTLMSEHYDDQRSGRRPSEEQGWRKGALSLCGVMSGLLLPLTDKSCFMAGGRKTRKSPWPLIKSTTEIVFQVERWRWNAVFFGLWRVWWHGPEGCEERSGVYVGGVGDGTQSNEGDGDVISGKETPTIWQLQKITRSYKLIKIKEMRQEQHHKGSFTAIWMCCHCYKVLSCEMQAFNWVWAHLLIIVNWMPKNHMQTVGRTRKNNMCKHINLNWSSQNEGWGIKEKLEPCLKVIIQIYAAFISTYISQHLFIYYFFSQQSSITVNVLGRQLNNIVFFLERFVCLSAPSEKLICWKSALSAVCNADYFSF